MESKYIKEFNEDVRDAIDHEWDDDNFYDFFHEWIDNKVIYTYEAKQICEDLDYDIFQEHEIWGKAENWSQGAYAALYDHLMDDEATVNFDSLYNDRYGR